ncbi:hypothetical protein NC651_023609 [Populus alba x Populus x berolinensis]|nr:hypothetical protein NC651_023609 [Populus alba x Populus x berolinensis]
MGNFIVHKRGFCYMGHLPTIASN